MSNKTVALFVEVDVVNEDSEQKGYINVLNNIVAIVDKDDTMCTVHTRSGDCYDVKGSSKDIIGKMQMRVKQWLKD